MLASMLKTPHRFVLSALSSLQLHCDFYQSTLVGCPELFSLQQLQQHVAQCTYSPNSPTPTPKRVVTDSTPIGAVLTASPSKLQGKASETLLNHLVRSKPVQGSLEVHTGGRTKLLTHVTQGTVPSSAASRKTVQRRSLELQQLATTMCGSTESAVAQQSNTLATMPKAARDKLLCDAGLSSRGPSTGSGLALKVDLQITWHSMRKLRRWLKEFGVVLESEKVMRGLVERELPFTIVSESVPMVDKHGTVLLTPMAVIADLTGLVKCFLDANQKAGLLSWHDGALKQDEVVIKIGGDHGGKSFKLCFEIANVESPNALLNTVPFCVFEGKDSPANLATALVGFQTAVAELQGMQWGRFTVRVVLFGDYEFQTHLYGLSGSSGIRPCLHCHTTKTEFQTPPQERCDSVPRTLESLSEDLTRYEADGRVLTRAKNYNNVIRPVLLPIPITNACIRALHLDLGIFVYLYDAMLADSRELDLLLAKEVENFDGLGSNFANLVRMNNNYKVSQAKLAEVNVAVSTSCNQLSWLALHMQEPMHCAATGMHVNHQSLVGELQMQCRELLTEKRQLEQECQTLETELNTVKTIKDGPCSSSFDPVLQHHNICRQPYHGGAFICNHIKHALTPEVTSDLVSAPEREAEKLTPNAPGLLESSRTLSRRYSLLFSQFANCRRRYSSCSVVTEHDLVELQECICAFMASVRQEIVARYR